MCGQSVSSARSSLSTDPLVLFEVTQSGKILVALGTRVLSHPTMFALVSSEIFRAEKSPLTARLIAHKGLLSTVFLEMVFKVI